MWKKKPLLLAIVMIFTFIILAFQYKSVSRVLLEDHPTARNDKASLLPKRNLSAFNSKNKQSKSSTPTQYGIFDYSKPEFLNPQNSHHRGKFNVVVKDAEASNYEARQSSQDYYVPNFRIVHLDLKGAPPKISYLKMVFPLLREAGANGVLLEYEDMFPYEGILKPIAAKNAYSKQDIASILSLAKENNMEVIPLVQTFGHLEFVLKVEQFRHLREVDEMPMAICPSKNESFDLVTTLIDQIMSAHPFSRWLHIGCDEVFHMGICKLCRRNDRDTIFLNHVIKLAKYVKEKYNVIPIIWDDMLRNIDPEKMKENKIGELVEPMIWCYVKDIYRYISYPTFSYYSDIFPNIWAASAFKGAFGETLTVPNVKMHLENNIAWLDIMSKQSKNFKSFRGIVITGWQRYDHLGVLCELFPSGLPSLITDLITLKHGHYDPSLVFKDFDKIMSCNSYYKSYEIDGNNFEQDPYFWYRAGNCFFPGSAIFKTTQVVSDAIKRVNDFIYDVTIHKAWLTQYNFRHNISNPFRIDEGLEQQESVLYQLSHALRSANESLRIAFDDNTVSEWIEQNIYPYLIKMETLIKDASNLRQQKVWPVRPINKSPDLERFLKSNGLRKK